jgi:DNA ligase (NAD+)
MKSIEKLESLIRYHKALYYQGNPEISDHEYDKLEEELKKIDPDNPVLKLVGTTVSNLKKVKHDTKMLSLDKKYEYQELADWAKEEEIVSVFKIDGVSCSLIYENGNLVLGKTRGDGTVGEDITEKVKWVSNIPMSITNKNKVEVRGELYCNEKDFFNLSEEMENLGLEKPKNQRNIVAGLIGRKDHIELARYIKFMAFDYISESLSTETEYQKLELVEKEKFQVPDYNLHKKMKGVQEIIDETKSFMSEGDYLIDGIVFTYNKLKLHDELGATAHHPRYRMAFKFRGESKQTKIERIVWSISRNGILTPVAEVEPVELSGASISRVTLHNYGMVKQHELKKGDVIEIIRSGEVIPKFLSVVTPANSKPSYPEKCPVCETKVDIVDIRILCPNEVCPGKIKESILNYIQKIGIDDLSSKRLDEMIKKGIVKEIKDLYLLTLDDLLSLDKTKEKLANKLLNTIKNSTDVDIVTFLSALGIQGGAYNKCERIVDHGFNTIEKILSLTQEQLHDVEGFAEKSSSEFVKSLETKKKLINDLLKIGIKVRGRDQQKNINSEINGKSICITGALSRKRSDIEKVIRENGGKAVSSVSKNTDYLLTNETEAKSSKYKKASTLGIPIITEDEFFEMI